MHGTLRPSQIVARSRPQAAFTRNAIIAAAVGVLVGAAFALGYHFIDSTERGHRLLIDWGFEDLPDCG